MQLAGMSAAGAALSSCSSFLSTPGANSGQVQLVYQDWNTTWFPAMAQRMLDEFHASHPNIRVFYVQDPDNLPQNMLDDMQAGIAADVFQGCCTHFPIWAQKGYTLDLRPYVKADLDKATIDDWDPAQYKAFFLRDGRQFGVPKYHGALALYYNKDYFDKYKVDYPDGTWTYDDYLQAMKQLTQDQNGDSRTDLWGSMIDVSWERIQVHVNGWGGHFVDPEDPTKSLMGEERALAAMQWIRDRMWSDGTMASYVDVQKRGTRQAFVHGDVAMVEDGSWALRDVLSGARFRVGVAPFPAGPVQRVTLATTDGFGIFSGTKHPAAAWELVRFLISKDYGRAMAKDAFLQPARESLVDEWVSFVRAEYPQQSDGVDIAAFADGHRRGYSVTSETFANMAVAQEIAQSAWDQIFVLGQESVDSMKDASRRIEEGQQQVSGEVAKCC